MVGTKYVNQVDELGNLHHTKEPVLSNAEIRTMKDNEALFIFSNKLPIKMKIKPYTLFQTVQDNTILTEPLISATFGLMAPHFNIFSLWIKIYTKTVFSSKNYDFELFRIYFNSI